MRVEFDHFEDQILGLVELDGTDIGGSVEVATGGYEVGGVG